MRKTLTAAAASAALLLAACGDDSDDDGGNDLDAGREEADDSGGDVDEFCEGYAEAESPADAEALTPPAEIADDWDDLMDLSDLPSEEAQAAFSEMEDLF